MELIKIYKLGYVCIYFVIISKMYLVILMFYMYIVVKLLIFLKWIMEIVVNF